MEIVEVRDINILNDMIERTFNSSFRGVVGGDRDVLTRFVESHGDTYEKLRFTTENIFSFAAGINMPPGHFLFEPYNDHINYYMAAGLAEKSMKTHYRDMKMEISKEEKKPEVLTMDHLGAGFVISFIPAMFGLIAFAGEFCYVRYIQRKQALQKKVVKKAKKNKKKKNEAQEVKAVLDTNTEFIVNQN